MYAKNKNKIRKAETRVISAEKPLKLETSVRPEIHLYPLRSPSNLLAYELSAANSI